ncbi:MAG: WhiB family transcriptional regulator [Pseudonocardiaceae bacterium]
MPPQRTLCPVDREGTVRLLAAILTDQPRLPGAACRGRHALFDPIRGNEPGFQRREQVRRTEAARICAGCPVRTQCRTVATNSAVTLATRRAG